MNKTDSIIAQQDAIATKKAPGRPVVANSARQAKIAAMQERIINNGGNVRLGRPPVEGSVRQQQIAAKAEAIANGYVPKRGRPSYASLGKEKAVPKKTNKSITQLAIERAQARMAAQTNITVEAQAPAVEVETKKSKKKVA
jgi:hypothetical protein